MLVTRIFSLSHRDVSFLEDNQSPVSFGNRSVFLHIELAFLSFFLNRTEWIFLFNRIEISL